MLINQTLSAFKNYLTNHQYSQTTIQSYFADIKLFSRYLKHIIDTRNHFSTHQSIFN